MFVCWGKIVPCWWGNYKWHGTDRGRWGNAVDIFILSRVASLKAKWQNDSNTRCKWRKKNFKHVRHAQGRWTETVFWKNLGHVEVVRVFWGWLWESDLRGSVLEVYGSVTHMDLVIWSSCDSVLEDKENARGEKKYIQYLHRDNSHEPDEEI